MQVERKMWANTDGLPLGAKTIASKIRQLNLRIATMTAFNKHITEHMGPVDLTSCALSQGRS